jgi:hypothetical protein
VRLHELAIPILAGGLGATLAAVPISTSADQTKAQEPHVITVPRAAPETNTQLAALVAEIRKQADAFVFLSGGASKMQADHASQLLKMFYALADVAKRRRIAVGDGGTKAGIMEVSGLAREASGYAFPLIGITPAGEIPPRGQTPIDPHHSDIVAVDDPSAKPGEGFGTETELMYWLFARLAEGRPSVTVVANGGGIVLNEVDANVRAGRRMIVIEDSGRAADAIVSLLKKTTPSDAEVKTLRERAEKAGLTARPELFRLVPLQAGAAGLGDAIIAALDAGK